MIDFFLKIPLPVKRDYISKVISLIDSDVRASEEINLPENYTKYFHNNTLYVIIGDLIVPKQYSNREIYYRKIFSNFSASVLQKLKGHFYILEICGDKPTVSAYNSLFSIFPIYYHYTDSEVFVSSKINFIKENSNKVFEFDKRFILESVLFNYPVFNTTYFKNIKLLDANSYLSVRERLAVIRHLRIEDYYVEKTIPWRKSRKKLAGIFMSEVVDYFPDEKFNVALTGGLDGRTITSCALANGKKDLINAFCFGSEESLDVKYSKQMAKVTGIRYKAYELTDNYIRNDSLQNGLKFIQNSEGFASFARAHYLFSAKMLSKKSKYMVTGNFGSDVLRGFNVAGVMASPLIVSLFEGNMNVGEFKRKIESSYEMSFLNIREFESEVDALLKDIEMSSLFKSYSELTQNQRFYIFVFEEIFRKYFGPEIMNQANFLYNRTPFLDFNFIKELLKTDLAGANQEFFVKNPLKRFRGQGLYPFIIKNTYPALGIINTDNGYRPADLINPLGVFNIARHYINKKTRKANLPVDPFAVKESFRFNKKYFENVEIDEKTFNKNTIKQQFDGPKRKETLFIALSQNWWKSKNKGF